jgi:cytochrome c5
MIFSAVAFALVWIVTYLHPTPHYVPLPPWTDKLVWFAILVGGATTCVFLHLKLQPYLSFLQFPVTLAAGMVSFLSLATVVAYYLIDHPVPLAKLEPAERIKNMGCLSCHSMGGVGYPIPGDGLESVASRSEYVVLAFLMNPDAEHAKQYGIREIPTGEMASIHLTQEEAKLLTEALTQLFEVKPPSKLGPGWDHIEPILTEKTCLACHTLHGEGAPDGGIGGPLEESTKHELNVLVQWLNEPTAENAVKLNIREVATGAMTTFALNEEEANEVAKWLKSLENNLNISD